jgi:3-oxoacyl-[acyl-carrier protein] reductase
MTNDYPDLFSVGGQLALVTGASRGIGAAIADTLGSAGATVIGTATTQSGADAISERFQTAKISGRGVILDVGDAETILELQKDISANEGNVSILINNAGITADNLLLRMKDEEWDDVLRTNLSSVFHTSKVFLRGMMKARYGRIIAIASVVGQMGNAGQANYAAAKSGLTGFSKSLAREVGSRGITVNVVAPGFVQTEMTAELSEAQRASLIDQIPLNQLGNVSDVASAVLYLASPAGNYVTGETINVNGGMHMI